MWKALPGDKATGEELGWWGFNNLKGWGYEELYLGYAESPQELLFLWKCQGQGHTAKSPCAQKRRAWYSLLSFSHCFSENLLVLLDLLSQNHKFILLPFTYQLQISFQLSPEVRLGHLITHGVITCRKTAVFCATPDNTIQGLQPNGLPNYPLQAPSSLPSTSPMPRCPGRNRLSGVSPTYVRALIVSMCSACVASVPESHSWLLKLILSSSRVSHGPLPLPVFPILSKTLPSGPCRNHDGPSPLPHIHLLTKAVNSSFEVPFSSLSPQFHVSEPWPGTNDLICIITSSVSQFLVSSSTHPILYVVAKGTF